LFADGIGSEEIVEMLFGFIKSQVILVVMRFLLILVDLLNVEVVLRLGVFVV
jgi:hypothetical protein